MCSISDLEGYTQPDAECNGDSWQQSSEIEDYHDKEKRGGPDLQTNISLHLPHRLWYHSRR